MSSKKVLIVEDEFIIAMLLERMLKKLGYEVVGMADSGEEAIAITRKNKLDLILMDIKLKGELNGVETVLEIRDSFDMPVIFISGNTDKLYDGNLKSVNYTDFLSKPIQLAQLKNALKKIE